MPSVSIYCKDNPLGPWDEFSLRSGIGGAETAVIGLARILGDNGYAVSVYNDVPRPVPYGNVAYQNKKKIEEKFTASDVWIAWRSPSSLADLKGREGRKVLWLHDLVPEIEVIRYLELCDLIWVPSLFHRGTYPNVPDEKFVILPSGLIPKEATANRDPDLVCYTSDYNRGLDVLLEAWPQYLFKYPDAKLEIAYGPQTQEAVARAYDKANGGDLASRQWKYRWEHLQKTMALRGVTHRGRLSKAKLADLYERAGIMAYPSVFPETQCLVVTDAMYHGCVPVTTSLGALQETNDGGYTLPPDVPLTSDSYLAILIGAREGITEGRRTACRELASAYSWESLYPRVKDGILGV